MLKVEDYEVIRRKVLVRKPRVTSCFLASEASSLRASAPLW